MNAITHAGYANTPVIRRGHLVEDARAYEEFCAAVRNSSDAEGAVEGELVDRIASLLWRSRRPAAYEAAYLAGTSETTSAEFAAMQLSWVCTAVRALLEPTGPHTDSEFENGAVAAGHTVGLDMDDSWPQPRPTTPTEWNTLIETILANKGKGRDDAIAWCNRNIDTHREAYERAIGAAEWARADEMIRVLDNEVLLKTSRVESHLSSELAKHLALLRSLQSARRKE